MRIVDRYLVKTLLMPLAFCVTLFAVLFIVMDTFNNLDEFIRFGVELHVIATYYFYLLPSLFIQIMPVATLVALLFGLGNLNRHNEIVALKASGISPFQILAPYLFFGIVLSFLVFLVSENVVPQAKITSSAIMDGLIMKGKNDLEDRAIKNVTLNSGGKRMIYAREFEVLSQTLHDIVILENDDNRSLKSKLIAKKGKYDEGRWQFFDVIRYGLNRRGDIEGEPEVLPMLAMDLTEKPEDFVRQSSQVEFMSARQLRQLISEAAGSSRKAITRLRVDYYYKISFCFVSLIVILIGAPLAMKSERGRRIIGMGTSLAVVLAYYTVDSICLALGKGGHIPPLFSAWCSNTLFALIGLYLVSQTN